MDESEYFAIHWNGFKWINLDLRMDKELLPGRLHQTQDALFKKVKELEENDIVGEKPNTPAAEKNKASDI